MTPPAPPDGREAHTLSRGEPSPDAAARQLPATIGHYRILRLLGEGGMGVVYEAEQEQPRRTVALKVIKAAWASPELIRRFEQESQALARLHHPGIAQVYEAGTADTGFGHQPFFAMELIEGRPLGEYADAQRLKTRDRLALMIQVCEAVEHAHQRGIIHRDLKPGNILVDENGQPKILDFGLARVTDSDARATRQTDMGQLLGTLAYMSPEQVLADPMAVDTRSDVYALGVVLYELLAGKLPYAISRQLHDAVQAIREQDPVRLSTVSRIYRGDIETIVAKALEKDKSRRYNTAADLAADIQRHLQDEPIAAKPASATYQLQKFARRHKAIVAGAAAVFLVLTAGVVTSTWQAVRARRAEGAALRQRDRADAEAAVAKAVNQFLQDDLLSQASPEDQGSEETKIDPEIKARTLLDRAAAQVGKRFAGQPLVEAAIQETIGKSYRGLGLYPQAEEHWRRAYELSSAHRGADDVETLGLLMLVSEAAVEQDKYAEAVSAAKTVFEGETRKLGPEDPQTVVAMQNLGSLYLQGNQFAPAEPLLKKALELQTQSLGYDNIDTLNTSDSLATLYIGQSQYAQARALLVKGLDSYRRLYGPDHPFTLREMYGLGRVLVGEGSYPEAENLFAQVLAVEQRVKGPRHPDTLFTATELGAVYRDEGKFAQAVSLLKKVVQDSCEILGPTFPDTLSREVDLGSTYDSHGDSPGAEQIWRSALGGYARLGADGESAAANLRELLGQNLTKQRKYGEAESLLRQALAFREKTAPDNWKLFRAQAFLGTTLAGERKYVEAEPLLSNGYEGMRQRSAHMPANEKKWIRLAGDQAVALYSDWSRPEQAAQWRAKLQEP